MQTAYSEKVRSDAANSIMTHLKMPESQKVELSVETNEDSSISALRDATSALTEQLRTQIQAGQLTAQEAAHAKITYDNDTGESV
jgi:precorrin-2 methylase